ncbi:UNC-50 [Dichotomocladium elegans]|nr:UNC-50 [Dichotomocladium elegans]
MSLLPTTNRLGRNAPSPWDPALRYPNATRSKPSLLRRFFRFPRMDIEHALWQMGYLLIAPKRVYRNIYYHKQTKNQWARDDPGFYIVLAVIMSLSGLAWGITYSYGTKGTLRTVLFMILVDYLLLGAIVASFFWLVTNRFLMSNRMAYAVDRGVEWGYAFDVHCNSFFPAFLITYVLQFFFLPLLRRSNWISLFAGNTMYFCAAVWYIYITFLGYSALPFLDHTVLFLYPIAIFFVLYIASLFGLHISQRFLAFYFGN